MSRSVNKFRTKDIFSKKYIYWYFPVLSRRRPLSVRPYRRPSRRPSRRRPSVPVRRVVVVRSVRPSRRPSNYYLHDVA